MFNLRICGVPMAVPGMIAIALAASLSACTAIQPAEPQGAPGSAATPAGAAASGDSQRPAGWRDESHSNDVEPNYAVVFPVDAVNSITITIAPEDWAAMQADISEIFADTLPIREAIMAAGPGLTEEERLAIMKEVFISMAAAQAANPPSPAADGAEDAGERTPLWVPATITFQDQEWTNVGVRYKGVTSLNTPWMMGETRLPFKLDFDEFEDDVPAIKNQRFFGFKQLSLANNYRDPAGMRDMLVYDLLDEAGLPSVQTTPYSVVLDYGDGPLALGLYTMIEVVDDTGVSAYFGSDDGNIYEGDGRGASLAVGNAEQIEAGFEKKNNEDEADWSDIWALYDVLHDERRTGDPAAWRADLEAIFDVDGFLEWLGISAIVGHWDVFNGPSAHNFYLYNDPATGRLTWFSWDHNLTFLSGMLDQIPLGRYNTEADAAPDDLADAGFPGSMFADKAPLRDYLLDDPVYYARYKELLAENFAGAAAPDAVIAKARDYAGLIAPAAAQQMTPAEYDAAVQEIVDFVTLRAADVVGFLAQEE